MAAKCGRTDFMFLGPSPTHAAGSAIAPTCYNVLFGVTVVLLCLCTDGPPVCADSEFACSDGSCISDRRRCDGYPDCGDSSDEYGCPTQGTNKYDVMKVLHMLARCYDTINIVVTYCCNK